MSTGLCAFSLAFAFPWGNALGAMLAAFPISYLQ